VVVGGVDDFGFWLLVGCFWFLVFGFEKRDRLVVMGLRSWVSEHCRVVICNSHECPITSSLLYFLGVHETAMHGTPGQWHPRAPLLRLGCPRAVKSKPPFADRQKGFLLASPLRVVLEQCSRVWMLYWLNQWNEQKTPGHFSSQSAPLFTSHCAC
jgi:hypothetical protein